MSRSKTKLYIRLKRGSNPCSAQLRLKILLINIKMPTMVDILTFISRINFRLQHSKSMITIYLGYLVIYEQFEFYAQLS